MRGIKLTIMLILVSVTILSSFYSVSAQNLTLNGSITDIALAGNDIIISYENSSGIFVARYNTTDGNITWIRNISVYGDNIASVVYTGRVIAVTYNDNGSTSAPNFISRIVVMDDNGTIASVYNTGSSMIPVSANAANGKLAIAFKGIGQGDVRLYNLSDYSQLFQKTTSHEIDSMYYDGSNIFVVYGKLIGRISLSGVENYAQMAAPEFYRLNDVVVYGGKVYVAGSYVDGHMKNAWLYARIDYSLSAIEKLWERNMVDYGYVSKIYVDDSGIYLFGNRNQTVEMMKLSHTNTVLWTKPVANLLRSGAFIVSGGDLIVGAENEIYIEPEPPANPQQYGGGGGGGVPIVTPPRHEVKFGVHGVYNKKEPYGGIQYDIIVVVVVSIIVMSIIDQEFLDLSKNFREKVVEIFVFACLLPVAIYLFIPVFKPGMPALLRLVVSVGLSVIVVFLVEEEEK